MSILSSHLTLFGFSKNTPIKVEHSETHAWVELQNKEFNLTFHPLLTNGLNERSLKESFIALREFTSNLLFKIEEAEQAMRNAVPNDLIDTRADRDQT